VKTIFRTWCLKLQKRGNVCGLIGTSATVRICVRQINQEDSGGTTLTASQTQWHSLTALEIDGIANGPG
jgi:hypothetical protein